VTPIIWSPQAIRDVESIRAFIAQDSPSYAELVARRLIAATERLQSFPESGRVVPERQDSVIREVIVRPYRIVYRFRGDVVEIEGLNA
jgi:toxin ParE1/3/4